MNEIVQPLAPTPLALVQLALEKGVNPDQLGKLLDLQERWTSDRAKEAFARAMNQCQREIPAVVRDAVNSFLGNRYLQLETLQSRITPVFLRHGFSLSWSQGECPKEGFTRVLATLRHVEGHSEQYQGDYPLDGVGAKGGKNMNALQGVVSAHTYAQRDMLRLMFNVTISNQDTDGQADPETLIYEEVNELNALIKEKGVDLDRFLSWAGADSLDGVLRSKFADAIRFLKRKNGGGK